MGDVFLPFSFPLSLLLNFSPRHICHAKDCSRLWDFYDLSIELFAPPCLFCRISHKTPMPVGHGAENRKHRRSECIFSAMATWICTKNFIFQRFLIFSGNICYVQHIFAEYCGFLILLLHAIACVCSMAISSFLHGYIRGPSSSLCCLSFWRNIHTAKCWMFS